MEATSPLSETPPSKLVKQWYVMRDFKKQNAKNPAYKELPKVGVECFTPMHWVVREKRGKATREYVPVIQNLLFVFECRQVLDPIVERCDSLQYQFKRGASSGTPMTVPLKEMERFISAVNNDASPVYFTPSELTHDIIGKNVIITGGPLNGYTGRLLKMQGSRKRRLIVEIKNYIAAAVEVSPDFIEVVAD